MRIWDLFSLLYFLDYGYLFKRYGCSSTMWLSIDFNCVNYCKTAYVSDIIMYYIEGTPVNLPFVLYMCKEFVCIPDVLYVCIGVWRFVIGRHFRGRGSYSSPTGERVDVQLFANGFLPRSYLFAHH